MNNKIECSLEERTSKKGNTYKVIVIKLTDSYEALYFPTQAELELLKVKSAK